MDIGRFALRENSDECNGRELEATRRISRSSSNSSRFQKGRSKASMDAGLSDSVRPKYFTSRNIGRDMQLAPILPANSGGSPHELLSNFDKVVLTPTPRPWSPYKCHIGVLSFFF